MNNPIDFFRSLFKNKKTTLTGREAIALQYLHPEKGAINTGDYCTTQDIANLSPPYTPPIGLTKQYDLRTSGFDEISNDTGVAIINGTSGPGPYYIYLPSSPYEGMEFYMCSNVSTAYGVSTPSSDAIISYTDLTNLTNLITVNQLETLRFKYTGGIWVASKIQNYTITSDTVVTDEITEKNAGVGVTIDGVLLKDGKVDTSALNILEAKINLTSAEILSLPGGAQKTIIASPGAGKYIEIISASTKLNFVSNGYTQTASFYIMNKFSSTELPIMVTDAICFAGGDPNIRPCFFADNSSAGAGIVYKENSEIVITGGVIAGGNGTATIYISYRIVTL